MTEKLQKAVEIVGRLQAWIDSHSGLTAVPTANLSYSENTLEIAINDACVFCDQVHDSSTELTFEFCRDEYLRSLHDVIPFLDEVSALKD